MLKHLHISQLALIESLDLDISGGFSVITGETGAGKSIIMGALGLIMGDRADCKVVRTGAAKSVVEATFVLDNEELQPLFAQTELDYSDECIIRREVTSAGKSRAFINDTPVNQTTLRTITAHLIDIHSQYENLLLNNAGFQLSIVDTTARTDNELNEFRKFFRRHSEKVAALNQLKADSEKWRSERDYLQFQFDQLTEAALQEDEQEQLERELELLNHTEEIKTDLASAVELLDNDEYGIMSRLKEAAARVESASRFMDDVTALSERLTSLYIDLKDVDGDLNTHCSSLEFDPARKMQVETRLDTIYTLEQKHHLSSCAELLDFQRQLSEKLQRIDSFDDDIKALTSEVELCAAEMRQAADKLTAKRRSVTAEIASYLTSQLVNLGMPNAQVAVEITPLQQYTLSGVDDVQFMFSANRNVPLRPIMSVASGGEIARVMLALKLLTVQKTGLSTIIFDEVDTGVSGEIAHRMAEMMREMSQYVQVLTITHLPQIAAKGTSHYKVYKTDDDTSTTTHIITLSNEQRIAEIAEMLSGKNPTPTALNAAQELLEY